MFQVHDLPRLLACLQLMQGRPDAGCFRQMLGSLEHLLQLRSLVDGLAAQVSTQEVLLIV